MFVAVPQKNIDNSCRNFLQEPLRTDQKIKFSIFIQLVVNLDRLLLKERAKAALQTYINHHTKAKEIADEENNHFFMQLDVDL